MLDQIKGLVLATGDGRVSLLLESIGLALSCQVPVAEKFPLGSKVTLHTYLHWNAEQGPSLFGFEDQTQRALFETLIGCSGIGPKMGLAILEQLGVEGLVLAVQQHDLKALSSVSGIGAKKAEQIAVQLKHKIDQLLARPEFSVVPGFGHASQIRAVLNSLSYSPAEISQAVDFANQQSLGAQESFDTALRRALSFLSKNG
jgi:Holliday junction DNA helicase RuvA